MAYQLTSYLRGHINVLYIVAWIFFYYHSDMNSWDLLYSSLGNRLLQALVSSARRLSVGCSFLHKGALRPWNLKKYLRVFWKGLRATVSDLLLQVTQQPSHPLRGKSMAMNCESLQTAQMYNAGRIQEYSVSPQRIIYVVPIHKMICTGVFIVFAKLLALFPNSLSVQEVACDIYFKFRV